MRFGSPLGFVGNYFRIHRNQGTYSAVARVGECTRGCGVSTLEKPMKATPEGFCSTSPSSCHDWSVINFEKCQHSKSVLLRRRGEAKAQSVSSRAV
ncbi:hypothetical protein KQX54_017440 [Cotesia glomerata]|uniref:Uncharacterized protein n=1 Tax=Cotesia glomerata TaxID=32391 RepID=A0AAV7HTX9_COTGL|nr:hypothetical protein KQX54_017440 [Cotesia glomerata]